MRLYILFLALTATAIAAPARDYKSLLAEAVPLGGFENFMEKYLGECGANPDQYECRANASAYRNKMNGQLFQMLVGEESANMISAGPYDEATGEALVYLTPFFPSGASALTQEIPRKIDSTGNPIFTQLEIPTHPILASSARWPRLFGGRELRLQVIFRPQSSWVMKQKGGKERKGVKAKIEGIAVQMARTGETIGTWTP